MIPLCLCLLLLSAMAQARVTFSYSEVLQAEDISAANGNIAAFKCANGCKAYTDTHANLLYIVEWDEPTKTYKTLTNFNNIGATASGEVPPNPDPYVLKASNNYFIENRGEKDPQFVFYVVDNNSPNKDIPVFVVQDTIILADWELWLNGGDRMVTILSGKYDAVRYAKFEGAFADGYPRIYSMGYDAVAELQCSPVYQARSQESAEHTSVSVFSPITTVDYGSASGQNSVVVYTNPKGEITQDAQGSSVYMSPGYVGCSYNADQSYSSNRNSVQDAFKLDAVSLDANAKLHLTTQDESVLLTVNENTYSLAGAPTFKMHFDEDKYNVAVKWTRKFASSNFVLQLDFGLGKTGWTTSRPTTTTSSSSLSTISALIVVLLLSML